MTWWEQAAARYGAIAAGLAIGTAARYGLALSEGQTFTRKSVAADLLLLGLVGLVAVVFSDRMGLTGDVRAFASAMAAVSSDRLLKLLRARFEAAAEQKVDALVRAAIATDVAKVPAGTGAPETIRTEIVDDATPQTLAGRNLRHAFRQTSGGRPPVDQIELLKRLDRN